MNKSNFNLIHYTRYNTGRLIMKVNYNGLWKKLIDNKMKKKDLIKNIGISSNIIARMGKEEPVSLETVAKLCNYFSCSIDELISLEGGENSNGKIE